MSEIFDLPELLHTVSRERRYHEFLRVPAMSAGIYRLGIGVHDPQMPHGEDEIYYVIRGKAKIRLGGKERPIVSGNVIFVDAGLEHRFCDIEEELCLLVIFAPVESS